MLANTVSESKPFCAHSYTARCHISQADTVEVTLVVRMKSDYGTTDEIDVSGGTFYPEDGSIKRFGLEVFYWPLKHVSIFVQSSVYIGMPDMIEVTFKGHRNGVGRHYVTLSRIDLLNGEDRSERSYSFFSSAKMEVDKSYILQIIP